MNENDIDCPIAYEVNAKSDSDEEEVVDRRPKKKLISTLEEALSEQNYNRYY